MEKILIGIAVNVTGKVSDKVIEQLRQRAWKSSDSIKTIESSDIYGGQTVLVFELNDVESPFNKRIRHYLRKFIATAFGNIWRSVFVTVVIEGESDVLAVYRTRHILNETPGIFRFGLK